MALKVDFIPGDRSTRTQREARRSVKYRLQRVSAGLLFMPGAEKQPRVVTCQRRRKGESVRILVDTDKGHAHFNGLESCSSVWVCPVCSSIVTDHRRAELQAAITAWKLMGGEVYLMTLTMPHVSRDSLKALLELLRDAAEKFKSSAIYRRLSKLVGRIGNIRALEVTWGAWHGFHPHFHELIFARPGQLELLKQLSEQWVQTLIKVGAADRSQVSDLRLHAFDVRNGDYAADYVAKFGHEPSFISKATAGETWGAAGEMVKGQSKIGNGKHFTMFSLLLMHERGDARAGQVYREFAEASKGQRQLYWSSRLRDKLGLGEEKTDEQVVERSLEELKPTHVCAGVLGKDDWRLIVGHNARALVLQWAERAGDAGVKTLLAELRARPPTHSANLTAPKERWD